MYSRYNPGTDEKFYLVDSAPAAQASEPPAAQPAQPLPSAEPGGIMSGIIGALRREGGRLDYSSLIILLLTVMVFLEDGADERDLLIIAAALLIVGF